MSVFKLAVAWLAAGSCCGAALAGSMDCGSEIIQDGQREPVTRASVIKKCGQPDDERGNVLVYETDDVRYSLGFNSEGELQVINEEVK